MRRLLVKYFCMTHILIERGSLKLATATPGKGLNIDLNVAALMEEEPPIPSATGLTFDLNEVLAEEQRSIRPCDSATSRAAPIFVASTRENYDLPGDNSESFAASSSGVSMPSLGTTNDIKRKDLERLEVLQQRMTKIIRAEEPDQNSLKKQVRGAGQDGKWIPNMSGVNTLQLEGFGEVPRIRKSKGAILTSQHSLNDFIEPQSTQSRNPVEVLNFKYWSFVKVRKGAEIINDYLEPPGENRNENDLFRYLKTQNHPEQDNSAGVFWIERKYEENFFISYNHGDPDSKFPYPRGFTISKRASAIREIVLEIYDNKIVASQANDFQFLEKIKTQFNIKELRGKLLQRVIKMSTVFSIMYVLLYRENQVSIDQHVREFRSFVEELLGGLQLEEENVDKKLIKKWKDIMKADSYSVQNQIALSWGTVEYWLRSGQHHLALPSPDNLPRKKYCHKTLTEMVHKIILFSNCKNL